MSDTQSTTEQIIAAFEEGLSAAEISEAFGLSLEAVHSRLERAGIASRQAEKETKAEKDQRQLEEVIAMVRKGFRTKTISTMIGMSLPSARYSQEILHHYS